LFIRSMRGGSPPRRSLVQLAEGEGDPEMKGYLLKLAADSTRAAQEIVETHPRRSVAADFFGPALGCTHMYWGLAAKL
jgi:hypothetical protein